MLPIRLSHAAGAYRNLAPMYMISRRTMPGPLRLLAQPLQRRCPARRQCLALAAQPFGGKKTEHISRPFPACMTVNSGLSETNRNRVPNLGRNRHEMPRTGHRYPTSRRVLSVPWNRDRHNESRSARPTNVALLALADRLMAPPLRNSVEEEATDYGTQPSHQTP